MKQNTTLKAEQKADNLDIEVNGIKEIKKRIFNNGDVNMLKTSEYGYDNYYHQYLMDIIHASQMKNDNLTSDYQSHLKFEYQRVLDSYDAYEKAGRELENDFSKVENKEKEDVMEKAFNKLLAKREAFKMHFQQYEEEYLLAHAHKLEYQDWEQWVNWYKFAIDNHFKCEDNWDEIPWLWREKMNFDEWEHLVKKQKKKHHK